MLKVCTASASFRNISHRFANLPWEGKNRKPNIQGGNPFISFPLTIFPSVAKQTQQQARCLAEYHMSEQKVT